MSRLLLILTLCYCLSSCIKEPYNDCDPPLSLERVEVVAGSFMMGADSDEPGSYSDEGPQHRVTITRNFKMSRFEITNAQFALFLNAKKISSEGTLNMPDFGNRVLIINSDDRAGDCGVRYDSGKQRWESAHGKDNHPVVWVTWYGATAFAHWLKGSLPTEAQWEYACRAGKSTPFGVADGASLSGSMANIIGHYPYSLLEGGPYTDMQGAYLEQTAQVGSYAPNSWGLYDMHGNVWEWCADIYAPYTESQQVDPVGGVSGAYRVIRGGSWSSDARHCRSSYRLACEGERDSSNIGFRVVFNE